eukprot:PRCOL_00001683-RA
MQATARRAGAAWPCTAGRPRTRACSRARPRACAPAGPDAASLAATVRADADAAGLADAGELALLVEAIAGACSEIGAALEAAPLRGIGGLAGGANASGDAQKALDVVANELFSARLAESGLVRVLASEEEEEARVVTPGAPYVVVFDPLDGSRNVDVNIPVGTIFGVYRSRQDLADECVEAQALRAGREQVLAGYALYSVQTTLCLAPPGTERADFYTLDRASGRFLRSQTGVHVPARGAIYSLNDARYNDWPDELRAYIDAVRNGESESGKQYSQRYVCSLVADFHRTLQQGGWCGNPRYHLRVVYELAPLALVAERAGGAATDGTREGQVLDMQPSQLHERAPLFIGSREDIAELETYGDVRQHGTKSYAF